MLEEWRPVVGHEQGYAVSDLGRVWSHKHRRYLMPDYLLRPRNRLGYWRVQLYRKNGTRINRTVHTLVLDAFIGPKPTGREGAHLDGDTSNNSVANLAWVTSKENHEHRRQHGHMVCGEKHRWARYPDRLVKRVLGAIRAGYSERVVARTYGVSAPTVHDWKHGHTRKYLLIRRASEANIRRAMSSASPTSMGEGK